MSKGGSASALSRTVDHASWRAAWPLKKNFRGLGSNQLIIYITQAPDGRGAADSQTPAAQPGLPLAVTILISFLKLIIAYSPIYIYTN